MTPCGLVECHQISDEGRLSGPIFSIDGVRGGMFLCAGSLVGCDLEISSGRLGASHLHSDSGSGLVDETKQIPCS